MGVSSSVSCFPSNLLIKNDYHEIPHHISRLTPVVVVAGSGAGGGVFSSDSSASFS